MKRKHKNRSHLFILALCLDIMLGALGSAALAQNINPNNGNALPFEFNILPQRSVSGSALVQLITSETDYMLYIYDESANVLLEDNNGIYALMPETEYSLRVGLLMEKLREKNVRLIAINDNLDTAKGEDDFILFRNIIHEKSCF